MLQRKERRRLRRLPRKKGKAKPRGDRLQHKPAARAAGAQVLIDKKMAGVAAVKHTIKLFEAAVASEDIAKIKSVRPTMSPKAQANWEAVFRDYKDVTVSEECGEPKIGADKAELSCKQSVKATTKKDNKAVPWPTAQVTFALSKNGGWWHVEDVR